jgi:uncharacterized protein
MSDHPTSKSATQIALLLPLSGRLADAGEIIRDGFMAAYYDRPAANRPPIRIYDTGTDSAAAFKRAVDDGATFVVGPLGRESVAAIRALVDGHVPVLALNHLPEADGIPKRFYQFALAPEDEARQIAARALQEGQKIGAVLVPSGDWGQRVRQAFIAAFTAGGGRVVSTETYPNDTTDFSDILVPLLGFEESQKRYHAVASLVGSPLVFTPRRRDDLEFIFFAGQPVHGRLLRPQLKFHYAGDLPLYATSDIHDPHAASNQDLEGVLFVDVPWLLSDDAPIAKLRDSVANLWPGDARHTGRLFALGYDACVVSERLRADEEVDGLKGLSGTLTMGPNGRLRRTLMWAAFGADGVAKSIDR